MTKTKCPGTSQLPTQTAAYEFPNWGRSKCPSCNSWHFLKADGTLRKHQPR